MMGRWGLVGALAAILRLTACGPGPEPPGGAVRGRRRSVDWNRYYLNDETNRIMEAFTLLYPELTELRSIGQSYLGADLMLMTVTNKATGPASEKPALYLDGNIHAQELTSSSVALYVMAHLLNNYGKDPRITELLDTRTFYVRPKFNPDGSDLVLKEDQFLRSSVRPVDENGDGIPDSDPPEDLDGDGRILIDAGAGSGREHARRARRIPASWCGGSPGTPGPSTAWSGRGWTGTATASSTATASGGWT
jgi:hypothetical protein